MKIRSIVAAGLMGETPKGGWSAEIEPADSVHTLIAVHTDEGLVGWGSVFTSDALVNASLQLLEPLYRGESALEPAGRISAGASIRSRGAGTSNSHPMNTIGSPLS